jgi:anthranilate phosphoribosyltransferase
MEQILEKLKKRQNLTFEESKSAFELLMTGKASEDQIYDFLTLLSDKGEVSDEIAGGVYVLRDKSKRVNVIDCIDTCGTGGDGMNTLNISTASALLLASMGIKVAKHGNKAVSSKCGSGDVLEALKIKINLEPQEIEKEINDNNFGFMFAPNYHSAMKFVAPVRKKIGKRTIFNMIGPLSNPAVVARQVVGVFDKKLLKIFAEGLKNLNIKFAWIVNSEDGLDEISPYAKTNIIQLKDDQITEMSIDPKSLNVNAEKFENLIGDDANFNAKKMIEIFKGQDNDFSKAVCLNAAAGLIVAEKFSKFSEAYTEARKHILSGNTYKHLKKFKMPENTLEKIIQKKIKKVDNLKKAIDLKSLEKLISENKTYIDFKSKIQNNLKNNKTSIIAEIKKASPSAGVIIENYNPVEIAKIYEDKKVTCLSVLTEEDYFLGNLEHISKIKNKIKLPILCKDFFIDKFQVPLAKSYGADAILIILAGVSDDLAKELYDEALKFKMSVIVEVHTVEEAKKH